MNDTTNQKVRVPVSGAAPRVGVVVHMEEDENVGVVYVVRFRSGHHARLTPREVVFIDYTVAKLTALSICVGLVIACALLALLALLVAVAGW
jgi:hypothetical protein